MRTEAQLLDISMRAKCGYVLIITNLAGDRETQMLEGTDGIFEKLQKVENLISTLEFTSISLRQRNLAADKLVRMGVVAKNEVNEYYAQPGYWQSDYVNFTT